MEAGLFQSFFASFVVISEFCFIPEKSNINEKFLTSAFKGFVACLVVKFNLKISAKFQTKHCPTTCWEKKPCDWSRYSARWFIPKFYWSPEEMKQISFGLYWLSYVNFLSMREWLAASMVDGGGRDGVCSGHGWLVKRSNKACRLDWGAAEHLQRRLLLLPSSA